MSIDPDDPDFVSALARGLNVITCFGQDSETLTLSDIAERTGLSRGTARRFLLTLEALGYLRSDGKFFRLAPRTLNLGYAYLSSVPLWKVAQPIMQEVVDVLDESCSVGVLDGCDVVYIARIPPRHMSYLPVNLGTRMPAHLNAMGQVLLSALPPKELDEHFRNVTLEKITRYTLTDEKKIRATLVRASRVGYAWSDRQLHVGLRSIAVPIQSRSGRVEAALNASADAGRVSRRDMIQRFLPVLRRAAEQLSHAL